MLLLAGCWLPPAHTHSPDVSVPQFFWRLLVEVKQTRRIIHTHNTIRTVHKLSLFSDCDCDCACASNGEWNCEPRARNVPQDHTFQPTLNDLAIMHVAFDCGLLTRQKLAFLYHTGISDRYNPRKVVVCDFRFEKTIPRNTNAHRTLDKQAKTNDRHTMISQSEHG
jgi:hypothetical protein